MNLILKLPIQRAANVKNILYNNIKTNHEVRYLRPTLYTIRNPRYLANAAMNTNLGPQLVILEHPVDKFRFRYKSEAHGTHGSLTGCRSIKSNKTYPEIELRNFNKTGIIRCSLYQTNTTKPSSHSHSLVVHKEDKDVGDPHDVFVSPELGYIVRFENMGIIHTAKKDIAKELLRKKMQKLKFDLQCYELSMKQIKTLRDEADREAKLMNLNQVCLCFEAFETIDERQNKRICEPVYSNPINNLKSALTGELRICRLSIYTGSVEGNDDLILLVEKVNKNNIKVRFFELYDDKVTWEAYGSFTEADVHHQYAIVVRTPPYRDNEIDNLVNVFIELVRESDNKRSDRVSFRYKPKSIVMSRKRRRISSSSSSALEGFMSKVDADSDQLNLIQDSIFDCIDLYHQFDGEATMRRRSKRLPFYPTLKLLIKTYYDRSKIGFENTINKINLIFNSYTDQSYNDNTIVHDLIKKSNQEEAEIVFEILSKLNLTYLLNKINNNRETPLHVACLFDQSVYIRTLIDINCDPNIQDINGNTALHIAVRDNLLQCIKCLVSTITSSKLNVNLTNNDGMTPLHLAIRKNNIEFVRILVVKCNASVKLVDPRDGNNSLHLAVQQENSEIIKIILESSDRSNLNITNRSGHTVVDLAKALRDPKRQEILDICSCLPSASVDDETVLNESSNSSADDDEISLNMEQIELSNDMFLDMQISEMEEAMITERIQKDSSLSKNLAKILSIDGKWKQFVKQLKFDHLLFIWSDAESMLNYVLGVVEQVKLMEVLNALKAVDKEAARVMSSYIMKHLGHI